MELIQLLEEFDRDRPNIVLVIGAGVSLGITRDRRAGWRGLLDNGVDELHVRGTWSLADAERVHGELKAAFEGKPFDLRAVLDAAERISVAMGAPTGDVFRDWLRATVGSFRLEGGRTETLEAISDLYECGALVLTTNYDNLLCEAIGDPPVTWEHPGEFLQVINRERRGVLHIHGHWEQPSSVILGQSSYDRICRAKKLQEVFRDVWLHWSWIYVGCGDGLDDPNLGRLLRWGAGAFGNYARKDYFLGRKDTVEKLRARADRPPNLVLVDYADHDALSDRLRGLSPRERSLPFERIDKSFTHVRLPTTSPVSVPAPSWEDYLAGRVPTGPLDVAINAQMAARNWAFVFGEPGSGKTTAALRTAAVYARKGKNAFYLSLSNVDADSEPDVTRALAALRRLSRPETLLILDNAHRGPGLARQLWEQWSERPNGSSLLIVATQIRRTISTPSDDSLSFFFEKLGAHFATSEVSEDDLTRIAGYILGQVLPPGTTPPTPPAAVATVWKRTFGFALAPFVAAVVRCREALAKGLWDLPADAAIDWMREEHLEKLSDRERTNFATLAVLAVGGIELDAPVSALLHPGDLTSGLRRGLIVRTERGVARHITYGLRDPHWAELILAAQPTLNRWDALVQTCDRSLLTCLLVAGRFQYDCENEKLRLLLAHFNTAGAFDRIRSNAAALSQANLLRLHTLFLRQGDEQGSRFGENELVRLLEDPSSGICHAPFVALWPLAKAVREFPRVADSFWSMVRKNLPKVVA